MQGSKIRLSPAEAALFSNAEVILTKNSILQKTVSLLAYMQEQLSHENFPHCHLSTPKISKGENYLGLPYVVLDYPRIAKGDDLYFIRTLFWWGQFYSSTLQVAGSFKERAQDRIGAAYENLAQQAYAVGINSDPWQHHFESHNFQPVCELTKSQFKEQLKQQPHIKIAARWPLSQWDLAATQLAASWKLLAGLVP